MRKTFLALALFFFAGTSFALDVPAPCDGSGKGARSARKAGPRDGSGPIHTPGTGGGSGQGRRAGRR